MISPYIFLEKYEIESRGYRPNLASSAGHISVEDGLLFATFSRCAIKFLELAVLFTGIELSLIHI